MILKRGNENWTPPLDQPRLLTINTHKIWVPNSGQELSDAAMQEGIDWLGLIGYRILEGSHDSASHKSRLRLEILTEVGEEDLRLHKGEFTHTLCHHIPGPFLRALKMLKQHFPV